MPPSQTDATPDPENGIAALRRFLPYLWPKDRPGLRFRVVLAMALVIGAKCITLMMPFAYKAAIDHMTPGHEAVGLAMALVVAYAAARFGGVLFDNLRNAIFERVGQEAARRLAMQVFAHLHRLSLRFHLERRTGSLSKVIERGTKSIDTMLYRVSSLSAISAGGAVGEMDPSVRWGAGGAVEGRHNSQSASLTDSGFRSTIRAWTWTTSCPSAPTIRW